MTPEEFKKFYPRLLRWIDCTLRAYAENARTVVSRGFPRLPLYFSTETLISAKVVLVDKLPIPPLSSWGLTRFADFERGTFDGRLHGSAKRRQVKRKGRIYSFRLPPASAALLTVGLHARAR